MWPAVPENLAPWGREAGKKREEPYHIAQLTSKKEEVKILREQVEELMEWNKAGKGRRPKSDGSRAVAGVKEGETHAERALKRWTERRTPKQIKVDDDKGYKIRV